MMEHKNFTFEIKSVDYEGRTLEGFAAGIGNLDQGGDIIHPGAFRKTLVERGGRIKFLWQHDPTEPIGRLIEAREESNGLFVKAIVSDTARGRDALALLKDGAIGEMSIGYDPVKGATDYSKTADGATVRNLREIKLYEFSLVTFPMNEAARVTALKENGKPSEGKPYANVPDDKIDEMDRCVEDVMAKGHDKPGAIAICYTSVVEGKSLAESFVLHGFENPDEKGGDPVSDVKVGRTISRATLAKLKAARDVIDELCNMGMIPEEDELDTENKSATIIASPDEATELQTTEYAAGPVKPPTDNLLKLIELELSDLHYRR